MDDLEMQNPNLFITFSPSGGFFSDNTLPFQVTTPFTLNAPI